MKSKIALLLLLFAAIGPAQSISTGSGFYFNDTHIITCAHCVSESSRIIIVRSDNSEVEGSVLFADEELDIAVVTTDKPYASSLGIGNSDAIKLLDDLFVFGFPLASKLGSEISASQGKLNSRRSIAGKEWLQLDATINPGNSGGPILNSSGQVVGIAVARLDPLKMAKDIGTIPERINFAIPSNMIRMRLAQSRLDTPLPQSTSTVTEIAKHAMKATALIMSIEKEEESDSTPRERKQASSNYVAEAERRLRDAAANYVTSGNSQSLDVEMAPYAQQVDFYDKGIKNRDQIRADLAEQRLKWTRRQYDFSHVVRTDYDPAKDSGAVIVRYSYRVSNGQKRRAGEAESLIVFSSVTKNPKVILVKEHKIK